MNDLSIKVVRKEELLHSELYIQCYVRDQKLGNT